MKNLSTALMFLAMASGFEVSCSAQEDPCDYQNLAALRSELSEAAEAFSSSELEDAISKARALQSQCPDESHRIEKFIEYAQKRRARLESTADSYVAPEPVAPRNAGRMWRQGLTWNIVGASLISISAATYASTDQPSMNNAGFAIGAGLNLAGLVRIFQASRELERNIDALQRQNVLN
jgi:hypothetical protein